MQDTENSRGISPKIRVCPRQRRQPVTSQLAGMIGAPDHLIAVIGLGVSSVPTWLGAKALSGAHIPTVEAVTIADDFN